MKCSRDEITTKTSALMVLAVIHYVRNPRIYV